jgi:hypothetical protein
MKESRKSGYQNLLRLSLILLGRITLFIGYLSQNEMSLILYVRLNIRRRGDESTCQHPI